MTTPSRYRSVLRPLLAAVLLAAAGTLAQARTVLIDVRTPAEYAAGHAPGAINIPHTEIGQRIGETQAAKDDEVIVYCRSGRRSGIAQKVLQGMGYSQVENYGGLDEARARLEERAKTAGASTK